MQIGYARVSTQDQKLRLQRDALRAAGCKKIFEEKASGAGVCLPAREQLLEYARPGDVVVVFKLDRLGRSLRDLVDIVNALGEGGVGLNCLQGAIDTTTAAGKLTFHLFAALAEFENDLVRERTRAGLAAARARGIKLGRPVRGCARSPRSGAADRTVEDRRSPNRMGRLPQLATSAGVIVRMAVICTSSCGSSSSRSRVQSRSCRLIWLSPRNASEMM